MLLLILSLALLGGSANGAPKSQKQNFLGLVDESSNFVFSKEGQEINGVRVQAGTSGYLSSIQVRHGTKWSARHGSTEGSLQEVTLKIDESIVQVTGSNGNTKCLQHLTFVTDQGRKLEFGKAGPNQFNASSRVVGNALTSIFGSYDSACLTGLVFQWIPVKKSKKVQSKTHIKVQACSRQISQQASKQQPVA